MAQNKGLLCAGFERAVPCAEGGREPADALGGAVRRQPGGEGSQEAAQGAAGQSAAEVGEPPPPHSWLSSSPLGISWHA